MIVAGERSGDLYGAELATALKDDLGPVEIFGCGGESMRQAGVQTTVDAHEFAMVGITEVFSGLPRAYRAFHLLLAEADRRRAQLAILIDSPSLNLRLAKKLKQRNIPVIYFVSPQIWAWKRWRLKQLKTRIDKMLCIFEFEEAIYRGAGIPVEYVGHPLVDLLNRRDKPGGRLSREEFFVKAGLDPETRTVALLPGSREIEVSYNLPPMLDAAGRLGRNRQIQFVVAVAPTVDSYWLESKLLKDHAKRVTVRAVSYATYEALQHSDVAVVASGTATIEAALLERPMVVVYRVASVTGLLAKFMVDLPFYSMVNLLAQKPVVPELIQSDFTGQKLAAELERLLDHPEVREEMLAELRALRSRLGAGGVIRRTAGTVVRFLQERGLGVGR